MQKFKPDSVSKICLTLLSLTLLTQTVFGGEYNNASALKNHKKLSDEPSILNINSREARGFEATFRLDSAPIVTDSKAKINISLRDSDLKQALRMLADKAGMNIVFDKSRLQ